MSRGIVERRNKISIFWLHQKGYLPKQISLCHEGLSWTNSLGEDAGYISLHIELQNIIPNGNVGSMRLIYTNKDYYSGVESEMDYKVPIVSTPCNYGGFRYWFLCSLYCNGLYCGRRVGVLYKVSKYFGCRHCGDLAYADQNASKMARCTISESSMEKAYSAIKRFSYDGKPTKKYLKYLKMEQRSEKHWDYWLASLYSKFRR